MDKGWSRLFQAPNDHAILSVLNAFERSGIAFEAKDTFLKHDDFASPYNKVRMDLIGQTLGNPIFERLSGTTEEDYDLGKRTTLVTFAGTSEEPDPLKVPFLYPPNVIADVDEITSSIFIAENNGFAPIFHVERHRMELSYLYERFTESLKSLRENYPELKVLSGNNPSFGEVAFSVLNAIVPPEAMAKRTPQDIIKLRSALTTSRESFVSKEILELTDIASDNPWNSSTKAKVQLFIQKSLRRNITEYERQSNETWRKMFGSLVIHSADAAKNTIFGSGAAVGASGIIGLIAPGTSMWEMIAIAAAAGVAKESPKAVKSLVEAAHEIKQQSSSSIAYVSRLSSL